MTVERQDYFSEFDEKNHFRSIVKWDKIKKLGGEEFLWEILEPISEMIGDDEHEEEKVKKLSPGQKALHFFWYLDAEVINGGFIQFYWNGYEAYLPSLKKGLELVGNTKLLEIVMASELEYDKNIDKFTEWKEKGNWECLYKNLTAFEKYDDEYYSLEEQNYSLLEKYVRDHLDEFIAQK